MRKLKLFSAFLFFAITLISCSKKEKPFRPTDFVDPFIGTSYHGHVFLGANVPFGAIQVGPTNIVKGWDWCSGYHYSDSVLIGFSQLHLSGTGIGDLGDVLISPYTGTLKTSPGTQENPGMGYASKYSHADEKAQAGYYSVLLKDYKIKAELTASERVAFHKYTFPAATQAHISINLAQGIGWDAPVKTFIKKVDDTTLTGYRFSKGWAVDQRLYFAIKLSKAIPDFQIYENDSLKEGTEAEGVTLNGMLNFATTEGEEVMMKIGISPVSEENALKNIESEIPAWDFTLVADNARAAWDNELGKIKVQGKDTASLRTFYTALYHAFIAPVKYNDNDGSYLGTDKKVYEKANFTNYSVFSLWDTYRAEHPLFTIVQPERVNDLINTMLNIYKQQGKLPIWHLMGNETDCMVGYSAIPVIADAYFKGFNGFDPELAFEAMKASSMRDDYGMAYLKTKGYIPADKEKESVSKALEYCISDWCIAQMAQALRKNDDYAYYSKRAASYAEYFDPSTQFMRPKLDNGSFRAPFSPFKSIHEWGDYTEGNAWQYTWLVPHDVEGLIKLFGSEDAFSTKLDSLFTVQGDLGENASPDISGLIGQYAHGNEPGHHTTYLYAYVGQQWKTAAKVRNILKTMYTDKPDGLCGNEDCGQMSAWYVLSSLGFYPVNPANSAFVFGSPAFDEATISLPGEKTFTVKAINNSDENIYIQSAVLNGKPYTRSFITYKDIMAGGQLELTMGNQPNEQFGAAPEDRPQSKLYN